MNLPPLRALACFESVARLNSFSRAAEALHVSQSAVSHQIRQLEEYLGEILFLRQGRTLSLTPEGQIYYEQIADALKQIEHATDSLQGRTHKQLRFAIISSFAVRWVIPRLPALQQQYPSLDLSLEMTTGNPVLSERMADCFVTLSAEQRGFTCDLIYREQLFAICSQRFWRRLCQQLKRTEDLNVPLSAEHLQAFPLLSAYGFFQRAGEDWRRFLGAADATLTPEARVQHFSHTLLALEAARHHQGIALTNDYMYNAPHDPDLVRLPCHTCSTGDSFYFAFKTSRRDEPSIQLLRQWVLSEARISGLLTAT
ncbi:LysR family transcriptional regulator [Marinobacter sp.]|uniref:LysR family transcriptional regulator n=1 Tax=Marinobacter sp. TaxID=50741 RepID=UPI003850B1C1